MTTTIRGAMDQMTNGLATVLIEAAKERSEFEAQFIPQSKRYRLTDIGSADNFLGLRLERFDEQRQAWQSYIDLYKPSELVMVAQQMGIEHDAGGKPRNESEAAVRKGAIPTSKPLPEDMQPQPQPSEAERLAQETGQPVLQTNE